MKVDLLAATSDPIKVMYISARRCSSNKTLEELNEAYRCLTMDAAWHWLQTKVLASGHHSILEHVVFTFHIEGISRACSHQLVRHRHATFSQQSQRYTETRGYSLPDALDTLEMKTQIDALFDTYNRLLVPTEDARAILPNCALTSLTMTVNLRELKLMCSLRLCNKAQAEIRTLFAKILSQMDKHNHLLSEILLPKCDDMGYCEEANGCGYMPSKREVLNAHYAYTQMGESPCSQP